MNQKEGFLSLNVKSSSDGLREVVVTGLRVTDEGRQRKTHPPGREDIAHPSRFEVPLSHELSIARTVGMSTDAVKFLGDVMECGRLSGEVAGSDLNGKTTVVSGFQASKPVASCVFGDFKGRDRKSKRETQLASGHGKGADTSSSIYDHFGTFGHLKNVFKFLVASFVDLANCTREAIGAAGDVASVETVVLSRSNSSETSFEVSGVMHLH